MKKRIVFLVTTAITAGVIYGLSEYFRKPMSAIDQKADMNCFSEALGTLVDNGKLLPGAIVEVSGEIISAESESVDFKPGYSLAKARRIQLHGLGRVQYQFKPNLMGLKKMIFLVASLSIKWRFLLKNMQSDHLTKPRRKIKKTNALFLRLPVNHSRIPMANIPTVVANFSITS